MNTYFSDRRKRLDEFLDQHLDDKEQPGMLIEAMRYSCLNGGKRFRGLLVYATGECLGGDITELDAVAAAVEMIHAYSLIHDDLPAMDDDDLRRGKPSCHRAYNEATAILAGDALQAEAFKLLVLPSPDFDSVMQVRRIQFLAEAVGYRGLCGGQAIDLQSTGQAINLPTLKNMHRKKTGALIRASVSLGAITAQCSDKTLATLDCYAQKIGLAFQIADDILDVVGHTDTLGKASGADLRQEKSTYVSLMGLQSARTAARDLVNDAQADLQDVPGDCGNLLELARFIIERNS